jgi:hypothetical protein
VAWQQDEADTLIWLPLFIAEITTKIGHEPNYLTNNSSSWSFSAILSPEQAADSIIFSL